MGQTKQELADEIERLQYWLLRLSDNPSPERLSEVHDVLANRNLCPTNNPANVKSLLRKWDRESNRVRFQFEPPVYD